jgi:hypothetical protein
VLAHAEAFAAGIEQKTFRAMNFYAQVTQARSAALTNNE